MTWFNKGMDLTFADMLFEFNCLAMIFYKTVNIKQTPDSNQTG